MTFYPTWQATPPAPTTTDQSWQNQFMNQIPQTSIASVTSSPMTHIELQQVIKGNFFKTIYFVMKTKKFHLTCETLDILLPNKWIRSDQWTSV